MRISSSLKLSFLILAAASVVIAQKPPQRPKVHSDFFFGTSPVSRDAINLMSKEKNRFVVVAFHEGWDFDKIAKELKISDDEVDKLFSDLDAEHLVEENQDSEARPNFPVYRDKDLEKVRPSLQKNSAEFAGIVKGNWSSIETFAASLDGAKGIPKEQLLYQIVVGGILLGAMNDAFYEDKTLIPAGPKRGRGQRYFAWLAEGDAKNAGRIIREEGLADAYSIVSVAPKLTMSRPTLTDIRTNHGMILDEAESRRFRSFVTIFCKDKLLPYFKTNRDQMLRLAGQVSSSRYTAFGEFLAWYYNQMVNNAVDEIVESKRMQSPTEMFAYAVRSAQ
jgi:hypothetical protein